MDVTEHENIHAQWSGWFCSFRPWRSEPCHYSRVCDFLHVQLPPSCSPHFSGCCRQNRPYFPLSLVQTSLTRAGNCEISVIPPKKNSSWLGTLYCVYYTPTIASGFYEVSDKVSETITLCLSLPQTARSVSEENKDMRSGLLCSALEKHSHFNSMQSRFRRHRSVSNAVPTKANTQ